MPTLHLTGMRAFSLLWFGQLISLTGSAMTRFAITYWAYIETGSATVLALVAMFAFAPAVLLSPVAGALVDRFPRKTVMIASDLIAGLSTVFLLVMFATGNLQIWHFYAAGLLAGVAEAFQFPAFSAAITMLIDKQHYARAHGMLSLAQSASTIAAPFLAATLLALVDLGGVLMVDVVTFMFAVVTLALLHIPQPQTTAEGLEARGSLWQESLYGFRYIWRRPELLGMQLVFFTLNLTATLGLVLVAPLVLSRTGNDEFALGTVQAMTGVGGVIGGLLMSTWGGPKRRVHGVFLGMAGAGLLGQVVFGLGQSVVVWALAGALSAAMIPIINGSNQAIWQAKVAPDVQGRVFAVRRLIAQITVPLAMILGGVLADTVFEPAMVEGGALVPVFGGLVGTGPGAGIAVIFLLTGLLSIGAGLSGYLVPVVRDIETRLPDYEAVAAPPAGETTGDTLLDGTAPDAAASGAGD